MTFLARTTLKKEVFCKECEKQSTMIYKLIFNEPRLLTKTLEYFFVADEGGVPYHHLYSKPN